MRSGRTMHNNPEPFELTPSVCIQQQLPKQLTVEEYVNKRLRWETLGRKKAFASIARNPTKLLFSEALLLLRAPLTMPFLDEFIREDKAQVALTEETENDVEDSIVTTNLAWQLAGIEWFVDANALPWSKEGLLDMQVQVFWESLIELGLKNNEGEKWDVLKWCFRPALRRYHVFSKRLGKSSCYMEHERDQTFSFYNCAMAARMDADVIRDGIRRNISADILDAINHVVVD